MECKFCEQFKNLNLTNYKRHICVKQTDQYIASVPFYNISDIHFAIKRFNHTQNENIGVEDWYNLDWKFCPCCGKELNND